MLSSGAAIPVTAVDQTILGVCVGFGKESTMEQQFSTAFGDPANLEKQWYDASAEVEADYRIFYIPAGDNLFEAQFDDTPTAPAVGLSYGLIYTTGLGTSGSDKSLQELDGDDTTSDDFEIVEMPYIVGNDRTAAYGRVWGMFTKIQTAAV